MAEPATISPDPPLNRGLDYAALKEEGTALVQRLAGEIWTDFNEHDPGVTTLEQLCYALTELSYRAEFPLKDLLINKRSGRINPRRQALFIPRRILPCNPVTINDYRKLILDRVKQVANVWLVPYTPRSPRKYVRGLYDIRLYVPGLEPPECSPEPAEAIKNHVRHVYCRHRDLCEDIHSIHILKRVRTVVYANVTIDSSLAAEAILARLLFNIGNFLAPELRRWSLKSQIELGKTPDEIFNGPLLRNGFIDDNQLQPKASEIPVQDIVAIMTRSAGVAGVRNVMVRAGAASYRGNESIPVPVGRILELDTSPISRTDGFTIRLFKNGIEYKPNAAQVRREMDKLWADYRRTYKLMSQYEEFFAVPAGSYRDVEQYYSVQNQFPNVYGINAWGLPEDSSAPRKAQAKQFKGYLMVFDQLMADFFAQLARVKDLYSIKHTLRRTYFYQYLNRSVPNVEPLLAEDYKRGLAAIVNGYDSFDTRRNRFLDFLLALYAEEIDASSILDLSCDERLDDNTEERLIHAKLALLDHLVVSTADRARGINYLASPSFRNIAGMEIKSRIQLGMPVIDRQPLCNLLEDFSLEIVETETTASTGRSVRRHNEYIDEHFTPVTSFAESSHQQDDEKAERPLSSQMVTEGFLTAAGRIENYRVGILPADNAVAVVCKTSSDAEWRLVDKYSDRESAVAAGYAMARQMEKLNLACRQLYIVEHILLRFGRSKDGYPKSYEGHERDSGDQTNADGDFVYDFTITAVVSAPACAWIDRNYQTVVREVIRQNTPAHIVVEYCFLNSWQMYIFEQLYYDWLAALRQCRLREIRKTSRLLREFLEAATPERATVSGSAEPIGDL